MDGLIAFLFNTKIQFCESCDILENIKILDNEFLIEFINNNYMKDINEK